MCSEQSKNVGNKIRQLYKKRDLLNKKIQKIIKEEQQLRENCEHEYVVRINNYHPGFYSNDYDDWEAEVRICVICGEQKSSTKFDEKNRRTIVFSGNFNDCKRDFTEKKHSEFIKNLLKMSLDEVLIECESNIVCQVRTKF